MTHPAIAVAGGHAPDRGTGATRARDWALARGPRSADGTPAHEPRRDLRQTSEPARPMHTG